MELLPSQLRDGCADSAAGDSGDNIAVVLADYIGTATFIFVLLAAVFTCHVWFVEGKDSPLLFVQKISVSSQFVCP